MISIQSTGGSNQGGPLGLILSTFKISSFVHLMHLHNSEPVVKLKPPGANQPSLLLRQDLNRSAKALEPANGLSG